jgi:Skp family chaperone for outer membrane proteins
MRNQATVIVVVMLGLVALAIAAGPLGAAPQANGVVAVIDNARVFDESNQGKAATQQIQANVDTWQ